jgi:thiopeptide-type bacteriocin biosynthesis protein
MLGQEYRADTFFWTRVGEKFTRERADLEVMFDRDPARDAAHDYEPGFAALAKRDAAIRPIAAELQALDAAGKLSPAIPDFAWSVTHMHANRLLHASQRAQELVLYDLVRRLYAARKARAKQSDAKPAGDQP